MENPPPPLKPLSPQEWETLVDDFQHGGAGRQRWTYSNYSGLSLLDLSLSTILRKDFPLALKLHIVVFLEQHLSASFQELSDDEAALTRLIEALGVLLQSPVDGISVTYALKEQFMVSTVSIFIDISYNTTSSSISQHLQQLLERLIELLVTVVNRPNHGVDRQTRAVACECLRELERCYPCLLSGIAGHLWGLCQSERTHAAQSYILLFTSVIYNIVRLTPSHCVSILTTSAPLVPFNLPSHYFMISDENENDDEISNYDSSFIKELRRAISFLLECPQYLTSCGMMEFVLMILPMSEVLGLQASLLKVQFSSLLYFSDPLMCHAFLTVYLRFVHAFSGQEGEVVRRLILISREREAQHHLIFRLLALHWLLGFISRLLSTNVKEGVKGGGDVVQMVLSFYPTVFDPLALKSLKIDLLAYCSVSLLGDSNSEKEELYVVQKVFEDSIVSVLAFKWLPPWSTETAVAVRTFHKFSIGASSHADSDLSSTRALMESPIFNTIQRLLVELTLQYKGLVPVHVSFIDRLLGCYKHRWLGERLLQTFDEHLLPKIQREDYRQLPTCFPIFERIAENDTIPPCGLIRLLMQFVTFLVTIHGPDTGLKSWSQGSKVLGICRIMLMCHHSSRLFLELSRLLAFTCLYFPDLEVRDDARIYLRMLICIPGKKLRHILLSGDQLQGIAQAPQSGSYVSMQYHPTPDVKKSETVSSYIHLLRVIPLLVKQSWSLSLSTLSIGVDKPAYLDSIRDIGPLIEHGEDVEGSSNYNMATKRIDYPQEPLRMMDSKVSGIIGSLRRHFSTIPDFRHMPGLKIKIPCSLHFKSEPFHRIWGFDLSTDNNLHGPEAVVPAMYAVVLTFSSSAPYGSIPSQHIPFLLGEPEKKGYPPLSGSECSMDIINPTGGVVSTKECGYYKARATIELEPREPVPGLVDVYIEANTDDGQMISGQLQSINIGIEDMFLRAAIPSDVSKDEIPRYHLNLFEALWEACGSSTNTAHETFLLQGGKGVAAISGTRSVKLIEVPVAYLIKSVEQHLAPFVVSVVGETLINMVKVGGIIKADVWTDLPSDCVADDDALCETTSLGRVPLYLKDVEEEGESGSHVYASKKRNMGSLRILIFLPPRFHLLLHMEVSDASTLVRIRTDHWPCLAYIDDYLEALFS